MSRILFLSQLLPYPLNAGPKIRSYYVLRHLTQKHKVTLVAFTRPDDPEDAVQHIRDLCADVHLVTMQRSQARNISALITSLLKNRSFVIQRDYVPEMVQKIDHLLLNEQFDAIHTDQLWMAQYALRARTALPKVTLVLDEHNACFQIIQRLAIGERNLLKRLLHEREWRKLKAYEAWACTQFDHVVTVTKEDKNTLEGLINFQQGKYKHVIKTSNQRFTTIPICVDTYSTLPIQPISGTFNVLHLGTMFWLPNIEGVMWFAGEVWPKIVTQVPQATFTIAGKNPPIEVQALSKVQDQNGNFSIEVTGYVPDPAPYLKQAGAFIVPLLSGGGMRVKIIDAWRWGIPVVSTTIGAEGIVYQDGENILIADNPEEFSQAVIRVLHEPILAERLRTNGRRWVEDHYEWQKVYSRWDSIYT